MPNVLSFINNDLCPICHRPAQLTAGGRHRHNTKIEDRLCRIQLEIINLRLEKRQLLAELATAPKPEGLPPHDPGH